MHYYRILHPNKTIQSYDMPNQLNFLPFVLVFIISCSKKYDANPLVQKEITVAQVLNLPDVPYDYATLSLPSFFTIADLAGTPTILLDTDNNPSTNPITNTGATLGRVLFYDKNLSLNRTISCSSCHQPQFGFSDSSVLSKGFAGVATRRNSMSLINSRFYVRGRFFWDERAATLEDQVLMPVQDQTEMGMTLISLVQRVQEQGYYKNLFTAAFGDTAVNSQKISRALSQFVRSIISYNSKYDIGRALVNGRQAAFPNFTAEENLGKQLYLTPVQNGGAGCFGCHTTEAFVSAIGGPQNNGLDETSTTDLGAGETFNRNPAFAGKFKTTTLRNVELTSPYMHDGRFKTLEAVIEHYNSGIKNHPNLAGALKDADNNPLQLHLTVAQKAALVAFLKTLTDKTLAVNTKYITPFR